MNRRSPLRFTRRFLVSLAFSFFVVSILVSARAVSVRAVDEAVEEAQFVLGKDLYGLGKYPDAIREFGRLLYDFETKKLADACRFYIGSSYYATGDYDNAIEHLGAVVERFPDSRYRAPSLYLMARTEYLKNRPLEAISRFTAYEKEYAGQDYADDSLYWKGEAYLLLEARDKARESFTELLNKYPDGNKADAARFKLRLMELEEKTAQGGGEGLTDRVSEELKRALEAKEAEIEHLRGEVETLRAFSDKGLNEREKELKEKIQALTYLENLLAVKEKALNEKERRLNEAFKVLKKQKGME